ncbi:MAG: flagellar biosynthesis anti-sigma factor FlgM [Candidatus Caldarchaeum sp.]
MKVSEEQVRKVLEEIRAQRAPEGSVVREPQRVYRGVVVELPEDSPLFAQGHGGETHPDADLIAEVRDAILSMPEVREELVAELRARIERGEYHVSAQDIAEAMVRRAIADRAGESSA